MADTRCPRPECRSRKWSHVASGYLITDDGKIRMSDRINAEPERAQLHYVCRCGHRYVKNGRGCRTLEIPAGCRVYDFAEVARLVRGESAGWPRKEHTP